MAIILIADDSWIARLSLKKNTNFTIKNLSIEGNIVIFLSLKAFSKLKKLIAIYIEELQ